MSELTPSRKKFGIARRLAFKLHRIAGNDVKAVFAGGSLAANIAIENSDIDMVVVGNDTKAMRSGIDAILHGALTAKEKLSLWVISAETFEDYGTSRTLWRRFLRDLRGHVHIPELMLRCALPVFGQKYANMHKNCWRRPNLKTIKKKYLNGIAINQKLERVKYKSPAARKRFLR